MKKKNVIIIILCIVVVALIATVAFLIGKNNSTPELPTYNPANTKKVDAQATDASGDNQNANVDETDIKVIKKYEFIENDDFKMVLVVENTGQGNAAVAVVGKIYDAANNVVGTERESVFMDPGAQSVVEFDFDTEGVKVEDDDYSISAAKATTIIPGIKNIKSESKINKKIVTVTSKNTGDVDLKRVEANVLFYDGDELVDIESEDIGYDSKEIFAKGTTRTTNFDTDEPFKTVKVYYTQSQDKSDSNDDDD